MSWGWPQFALAALMVFGMGVSVARYGQPKRDSYDLSDVLFGPALTAWILYMGGFWS